MVARVRIWSLIPAAGAGSRMGGDIPKQYRVLGGKPVLQCTLQRLRAHTRVDGVVVVISAEDRWWPTLSLEASPKRLLVTHGGAERCDSVLCGLQALSEIARDDDWVMVHDAARPCVRSADIDRLIDAVAGSDVGGILAAPLADTVKRVDERGFITETVPREGLWRALTPQMFRFGLLRDALGAALKKGARVTDEASAVELTGFRPLVVAGNADNIKITHREDLYLAETILQHQESLA